MFSRPQFPLAVRIALFLLLLGIPVFTRMPGLGEFIDAQNSAGITGLLKQMDELPAAYERHFNENFLLRSTLLSAYDSIRLRLLGETHFRDALIGRDGWLYYTGEHNLDDYQRSNRFSPETLQKITLRLNDLRRQLAAQGIPLIVVIAPNKESIHPEHLPASIAILGEQDRLDQFLQYTQAYSDTPIIDLRPALLAAKAQGPLYFRTDTHWNPYGAYIAYETILQQMPAGLGLQPAPLQNFERARMQLSGDLSQYIRITPSLSEESIGLSPRKPRLTQFEEGHNRTLTSTVGNPGLPRAIVYRDSFFNGLLPYFAEHFRQAEYFWNYDVNVDYITCEQPDVVILEVAQRYLHLLAAP